MTIVDVVDEAFKEKIAKSAVLARRLLTIQSYLRCAIECKNSLPADKTIKDFVKAFPDEYRGELIALLSKVHTDLVKKLADEI